MRYIFSLSFQIKQKKLYVGIVVVIWTKMKGKNGSNMKKWVNQYLIGVAKGKMLSLLYELIFPRQKFQNIDLYWFLDQYERTILMTWYW